MVSVGVGGDVWGGGDWGVDDSLVILCKNRDLSDGDPGPLPGTNSHADALDTLGEERTEVVGIHFPVPEVLDVREALA